MKSDFLIAVTQLAAERHLPREVVISAIEAALASAYRKDSVLAGQDISVSLNPANGEVRLYIHKTVVSKVEDSQTQISLAEAKKYRKDAKLDDVIDLEAPMQDTGRIAAQTAKQVVLQRLREAERELVFEEYAEKEGDVVTATVQRVDSRQVTLDLGRTEAVLPPSEQVPTEHYRPGQRLKVHVLEVRRTSRGPEIVVSRSHKDLLKRLFEIEVPEIYNGVVEIRAVAREPGSRSKVAVFSRQDGVDAVGSCVGLRGIRIQNIVNELQGEKIDVVQWHQDPSVFLSNALSPCPVTRVELNPEQHAATVVVPDRQLSLAIGRDGQNARLCAKLSGMKVTIKSSSEAEEARMQRAAEIAQHRRDEAELPRATEAEEAPVGEAAVRLEAPPMEEVGEKKEEELETATAEKERVLSIEEQLAEATLEIETETEEQSGQADISEIPEVVWTAPQVAQGPQRVRFAEEIMGPRSGGRSRDSRRQGRQGREEESKPARRARQVPYPREEDEEAEELDSR
ncbi:MAG: transcription termination/antitermination protein NusA [Chloroflexi bacterium]|nr:transcription termination/antitermination protein NusA [Chloroflexota bacterium]